MSPTSGVDHAVIGGVVAVIVFIMLCLLIVLGRYLIRHKGTACSHTTLIRHKEIPSALSHTCTDLIRHKEISDKHTHTPGASVGLITLWDCVQIPDRGSGSILPHQQLFKKRFFMDFVLNSSVNEHFRRLI